VLVLGRWYYDDDPAPFLVEIVGTDKAKIMEEAIEMWRRHLAVPDDYNPVSVTLLPDLVGATHAKPLRAFPIGEHIEFIEDEDANLNDPNCADHDE
jgi:hypothetical protein